MRGIHTEYAMIMQGFCITHFLRDFAMVAYSFVTCGSLIECRKLSADKNPENYLYWFFLFSAKCRRESSPVALITEDMPSYLHNLCDSR